MNMGSLRDYVHAVLDTNKDGKITFRDFLDMFPNHSVAIAVIFIDLIVAVGEYRVWDVGYKMTSDPFKAIGFVLVSAVPFYLGQLFWMYSTANGLQKWIAAGMVASSLYTSWIFGTADLSREYDVDKIVQMVMNMTAGYIVAALVYVVRDDGISAHRMKKQAEGAAKREKEYQEITRQVLRELAETQRLQRETEAEFGDPELVADQLKRLRPKQNNLIAPARAFAKDVPRPEPTNPTNPPQR
jgi:hypothetical protein